MRAAQRKREWKPELS